MGFVYGPEEKVASDATPVFRQEEGGLAWATVKSKGICVCERTKKSQTAVDLAPLSRWWFRSAFRRIGALHDCGMNVGFRLPLLVIPPRDPLESEEAMLGWESTTGHFGSPVPLKPWGWNCQRSALVAFSSLGVDSSCTQYPESLGEFPPFLHFMPCLPKRRATV